MEDSLKEKVKHGDFILPFMIYHGDFNNTISNDSPPHYHEEIEITLITNGFGEVNIDLIPHDAKEGDIFIIKPLSLHGGKKRKNTNMSWKTLVFNLNMIQSALTDGCQIKYFSPLSTEQHELPIKIPCSSSGYNDLKNCFIDLFNCYSYKIDGYELEVKSKLFHFFFLLYKNNLIKKYKKSNKISNEMLIKIKTVLNYIEKNYSEPITIDELSKLCCFSEYYFMKSFKKYIGMTCIDYINNYRLDIASTLLVDTDNSITDIAFNVGFNSPSYFNKLFKNKYKVTPNIYRKKSDSI